MDFSMNFFFLKTYFNENDLGFEVSSFFEWGERRASAHDDSVVLHDNNLYVLSFKYIFKNRFLSAQPKKIDGRHVYKMVAEMSSGSIFFHIHL